MRVRGAGPASLLESGGPVTPLMQQSDPVAVAPPARGDIARRCRRALFAALPAGAAVGALLALALAGTAEQGPSLLHLVLLLSGTGAVAALIAATGSTTAVLLTRRRRPTAEIAYAAIALGAGIAVALTGLVLSAISDAVNSSWEWWPLEVASTMLSAVIAAAAATGLTAVTTPTRRRPTRR